MLKAENGANTVYKGVNIDLTTGREMALTEIFRGGETFTNITGPYNDALLYEDGVHFRDADGAAYTRVMSRSRKNFTRFVYDPCR